MNQKTSKIINKYAGLVVLNKKINQTKKSFSRTLKKQWLKTSKNKKNEIRKEFVEYIKDQILD